MNTQEFCRENYTAILQEANDHLLSIDAKCAASIAFAWLHTTQGVHLLVVPPKTDVVLRFISDPLSATKKDIIALIESIIAVNEKKEILACALSFFVMAHRATCERERPQ